MSEQDHERPLTRRELRLREQAASAQAEADADLAAGEEAAAAGAEQAADSGAEDSGAEIEVEIDPMHPDGTPRTRREIRELREAAVAAILAERDAASPSAASAAGVEDASDDSASPIDQHDELDELDDFGPPTEALSVEDLPEPHGGAVETEADDELAGALDAPTEAFTLEDILDAAEPREPVGDAEALAILFAEEDEVGNDSTSSRQGVAESVDGEAEEIGTEADADDADVVGGGLVGGDVVEEDAVDDDEAEQLESAAEDAAPLTDAPSDADDNLADILAEETGDAADSLPVPTGEDEHADSDSDGDGERSRDTAGYSFPDIRPPEEWRSVFDDPARAANITAPGDQGDFDDLISRAVAQEGSTGGTGASALILPSHPGGDTGGLTGPLGATGELFVTGSIELPRSLGETGGHSALHDSIDFDPFLTGETNEPIAGVDESGPMPVSALSAVSAQRRPEVPVVAEPTKDRSKMPLILALSGGGLIVVVVGGVIYAATQGFFG